MQTAKPELSLLPALYRISELTNSAEDMPALYARIHSILRELMYAPNCFIAMLEPAAAMVTCSYWVDEKDPCPPPRPLGNSFTDRVLKTGEALLVTPENRARLIGESGAVPLGTASSDWLGVPLKSEGRTFGVLTVQSYSPGHRYSAEDQELLLLVSNQIASAISHRRNQESLRESEAKFRALAETSSPAMYIFDGSRMVYANPSCERIFGLSREELRALSDPFQLAHPDYREEMRRRAAARLRGEIVEQSYELKILRRDGTDRWVELSTAIITYEGKPAVLGTAIDVTERKRSVQLQTALYRISEQASSATDLDRFYASVHQIVGELMYAKNFYIALSEPGERIVHFPYIVDETETVPRSRPKSNGLTEYVLRTEQPMLAPREVIYELAKRGEATLIGAHSVNWMGVPLKSEHTFGVLAVQSYDEDVRYTEQDKEVLAFVGQQVARVIEHKRHEEALRGSENRYRMLFERNMAGLFRSTPEGRFLEVNQAYADMLGYSKEEMLANPTYVLYPGGKEEREAKLQEFMPVRQASDYEICYRRKDGKLIWCIQNVALNRDELGREVIEGTVVDVTSRRELEEKLRQSQKMEAIGRLAGGIAHDFNNLLTVIRGYGELISERVAKYPELRPDVDEVLKATSRAADLTGQLLAFSRQQVLAPKVLDLNDVITDLGSLMHRLIGEDVELTLQLAPHLAAVQADPGQLEQVLMNLAVNARDAMPQGGKLTIETAMADSGKSVDGVSGNLVRMSITDTGVGMDEETRMRLFEPFFTTKEQGKGTGLGLATVYGIVKQSGGHIEVHSQIRRGTTVQVFLPAVDKPILARTEVPVMGRPAGGSEDILVVEDEPALRTLVCSLLKREGYSVHSAANAEEALALCKSAKGAIRLLLSDVILTQSSGRELAQQILAIQPGIKIMFMSGYNDDIILQHRIQEMGVPFLQKPFTRDALARKVREVLDTPVKE